MKKANKKNKAEKEEYDIEKMRKIINRVRGGIK